MVIKLEFILKLKIKRNGWLLADTCPQAAKYCTFFFESETVLKFYNLEARYANVFILNLLLFSYPSVYTCVLGAQKNRLIETVLLSTHNICFG